MRIFRGPSFRAVWGLWAVIGLTLAAPLRAQEFRAAWADVFHVGMGSTTEVNNMVNTLVSGHYNAVIVQVVGYMDNSVASHGAMYKSGILPWSSRVTSGFDPLAYLCTQAHANGIEVHAWLGGSAGAMYRVSTAWPPAGNTTLANHPEWFIAPLANSEGGAPVLVDGNYDLDMGSPDAQEYIVSIVRELVTNYPIDGINWDDELNGAGYTAGFGYPAYSQAAYPRSGLARYRINTGFVGTPSNTDTTWSNYRRRFKNELMARVQAEIQSIKTNPRQPLRHTSAALAYSPVPSTCDFTGSAPYLYFCDWPSMLQNGWVDAVVPQTYSSSTFSNWVDKIVSCWQYNRQVFPGMGGYLTNDITIANYIRYTRFKGLKGNAIYSYAVANNSSPYNGDWWAYAAANVYTNVVSTPPMPWRNPATATEGIMWGRVMDVRTSNYVDDATVTVSGGPTVKTDGNGYYVATLIPATAGGTVHLSMATKTGYTPHQIANATVLAGDIVRYDFLLNMVPPVITNQPAGLTVGPGTNASFSVTAGGTQPLGYQWRFNGTNVLAGATSSAYTRSNAQPADAGSYSVVITNLAGSATSSAALLVVSSSPIPPGITNQPGSLSLIAGQDASFTVTAGGGPPLAYQWWFNNTVIGGATASSYTRSNAQPVDAGSYSVVVTNNYGAVTSAPATLTLSVVLATNATAGGSLSRSPDQASYAPNTTVTLTATPVNGYSFTGWSGDASGTINPLSVVLTTNKSITANFASTVTDIILDNTNALVTFNGSWQTGTSSVDKFGTDYRFASTVSGGTSNAVYRPLITKAGYYDVYIWYPQGSNRATNAPWQVVYNSGVTNLTVNQTANGGGWRLIAPACPFWLGNLGYVQLSNNSTQPSVVLADAVRFAFAAVQDSPPHIETPPQGETVNAGSDAVFSVTASGAPLNYQWRFYGTNLAGATTSSYTRFSVQPADAGPYSVVVSNTAGLVSSADALLTVNVAPDISSQPQSVTTNAGANVSFQVSAGGSPTPAYQWRFNGADISGATDTAYSLYGVEPAAAGSYSVLVSNPAGAVTSANAVLSVLVPFIDSIQLLANQGFQLQMHGGPGNFEILATPDFNGWTQLTTLSATGSVFEYLDPDLGQTNRFYRVKGMP